MYISLSIIYLLFSYLINMEGWIYHDWYIESDIIYVTPWKLLRIFKVAKHWKQLTFRPNLKCNFSALRWHCHWAISFIHEHIFFFIREQDMYNNVLYNTSSLPQKSKRQVPLDNFIHGNAERYSWTSSWFFFFFFKFYPFTLFTYNGDVEFAVAGLVPWSALRPIFATKMFVLHLDSVKGRGGLEGAQAAAPGRGGGKEKHSQDEVGSAVLQQRGS